MAGLTTLPKMNVLLVDDVEANLLALEAQLGNLDCELVRATSGNEALKQLLKREFAVMLLDVQMPEMDGYEVARLARENPATRGVPIVFVTAMHETMEDILRGYSAGAVDFLFKPVNPYVLRSKVRVFLDLSIGRRRLADEIAAHKETLADLEAFNYSVSHDLRAPLRPLDGFSQALLEDYGDKLDTHAKDHLKRIRAGAQRMGRLIEDLLKLSRLGRAEVKREPVNLAAMAESIVGELRHGEPGRSVELIVDADAKARADEGLVQIVLENLLRNAWKFTSKTAHSKIQLGQRVEQEELIFFVRDNGVGFDPAYAGRLFQPFQRMHSDSEFEGTGIGLAIVKRIILRHRGRIWVESAPGQGTALFFTLAQKPTPPISS